MESQRYKIGDTVCIIESKISQYSGRIECRAIEAVIFDNAMPPGYRIMYRIVGSECVLHEHELYPSLEEAYNSRSNQGG